MEGDTTVTRVFLVLDDDDKVYASPKGVYFETLMSRADEMWISKSVKDKGNDSPYVMAAHSLGMPIHICSIDHGIPTIRPKRERIRDMAYEL